MNQYLNITRLPYEEPNQLCLQVEASNGRMALSCQYYDSMASLSGLADKMVSFPRHKAEEVLYEVGSERPEDRFAYHFRLRLFLASTTGECAIQLRTNNNEHLPDREIAEFCIAAEPAQINRLGQLLKRFVELKHSRLTWSVSDGSLHE